MARSLPLSAYETTIALREPFERPAALTGEARKVAIMEVARELLAERGRSSDGLMRGDARQVIRHLLTIRTAAPLLPRVSALLDGILAGETCAAPLDAADLESCAVATMGRTKLVLWQGDITQLALDAIVNAGNSELLGCFRPDHACIDNVIHNAAGPMLREDCSRIMAIQGHPEITGDAKLTRAYHLPSRFVLHTVGPIVPSSGPRVEHQRALGEVYETCLDVAVESAIVRSVAFCSVSTGVFGYPKAEAAAVATRTVRRWVQSHPDAMDMVVFNVFSAEDRRVYEQIL